MGDFPVRPLFQQLGEGITFPAAGAAAVVDAPVQLIDPFASGRLVEAVDVLGDDGGQMPRLFQQRQRPVGRAGLRVRVDHLVPVKPVKLFGVPVKIIPA